LAALGLMSEDNDIAVLTFQNVAAHGKSLSDGIGGWVKNALDRASAGLSARLDVAVSGPEFAKVLVAYGNEHLSDPADGHWESSMSRKKCLATRFINFGPEVYTTYPVAAHKFPKQQDGHGVLRGIQDRYCFMYCKGTNQLLSRNLFCSCPECLSLHFDACSQEDVVSPFRPVKLTLVPDNTEQEEDDEETLMIRTTAFLT
jgi:hypothetical protein